MSVLKVYNGSAWETVGAPSGTSVRTLFAIGDGGGNYSIVGTSFADLDATDFALSIPAAAGDKLRMEMLFLWSHSNAADRIDATFAVNGTDVGPSLGVLVQRTIAAGDGNTHHMVWWRTVQAGDISGGNVPVKVRVKTNAGTLTVFNDSTRVCVFSVTNFGTA